MDKKSKTTGITARKLYFENYVEFEHNLRELLRKIKPEMTTKNKNLKEIIKLINLHKKSRITIHLFKTHLKLRNWLAHTRATIPCSKQQIINFDKIIEINKQLKKKTKEL